VRSQAFLLICAAALVLTAAIILLVRFTLTRSFADIEDEASRQGIERVRRALDAELGQLQPAAVRAAAWRATSDAFNTAGPTRPTGFTREMLEGVGAQLLWITDAQGRTISGVSMSDTADGGVRPLTAAELAQLEHYAALFESSRLDRPLSRLLRLPRGALAFALAPVIRAEDSARVGRLLLGRYLDKDAALHVAQANQLAVALTVVAGSDHGELRLPEEVRRWLASSPQAATPLLQLRDAATLNGYSLLRDVANQPLIVLSTGVHREALRHSRRNMVAMIITVIGGFTAIVLVLLALINRSWRARTLTEQRYQSVGRQLEESILLADSHSGEIVEANPAVARALGFEEGELLRWRLQDLSRGLSPARLARLRQRMSGRSRVLTLTGKDGRRFPAEVTLSWIVLGRQELICLVARDVTARRNLERQRRAHRRRLARLAHRDALTGLPNRLYLQLRLPQLISDAEREHSLLALLYIDLDHFKDVNDSLGHSSGDRLLTSVAKRLSGCTSADDLVVRMSGDEFIVIAVGLPAASAVDYIARRIQETLSAPIDIDGVRLGIVASIGISIYPSDGANLEQLLKHADIALYQAKSRGRGNHQFFTDEMKARLSDRLELEHALRRAIGTEQLLLEYQPSFDLESKAAVGFEALLRWNHPQLGLVPPGRFIPIAEQGNLILELGVWVLRRVCRQLAQWQAEGLPLLPVSVNVAPRQFDHGRLVETVAALTREFGIDANLLHFEITESAVMHNSEQHLGALQALRNLGSRILIDDFGTGYSSLSYLKHLPIDTLKIDRAFVRDMATDTNDAAIVSAIIAVAGSLGLQVVAEGVETAEHVECLLKLGCRTAQGFYFSRPLAAEACRVVLENLGTRRRAGDTAKLSLVRLPNKS
jgi:diguanylate cyclase (GGDEF)-like protein/PAS domain S-box-containing protein